MAKLDAFTRRFQGAFGLVFGALLVCLTVLLLCGRLPGLRPAYAAATDSKGSPNVAVDFFLTKDSAGNTWVKIVYADGHVADPTNGGSISSGTVQVTSPVLSP